MFLVFVAKGRAPNRLEVLCIRNRLPMVSQMQHTKNLPQQQICNQFHSPQGLRINFFKSCHELRSLHIAANVYFVPSPPPMLISDIATLNCLIYSMLDLSMCWQTKNLSTEVLASMERSRNELSAIVKQVDGCA